MASNSEQETQATVTLSLLPASPQSVSRVRYDGKTKSVEPSHALVVAGPFMDPQPTYLPPRWSSFTHPEGQVYFHRDSHPRIVTEAHLYRSEVMAAILAFAKHIEELILDGNLVLGDSVELLLQIDEDDLQTCGYYFVDHATRAMFWLEDVSTEDFGILPAISSSHLKFALEELYWNHVEYFPMHVSIHVHIVDELIGILIHGRVDGITSDTSTFPYTAKKCGQFIKALKISRDHAPNGFTTCIVARLWGIIANYRFANHHDQEVTRLSRNQSILGEPAFEPNWISTGTSRLLFGIPDVYRTHIEDIYVDDMLHREQWSVFVSTCLDDWKLSLSWAFPLLLSQVMLLFARGTSQILAVSSILVSSLSILSGILLMIRLGTIRDATDGAVYLNSSRSANTGYHPTAVVFSLPKALCFWSLILLISQAIVLALHLLSFGVAIGSGIIILLFIKGITLIIWPQSDTTSLCSNIFCSLSWRRLSPELGSKV